MQTKEKYYVVIEHRLPIVLLLSLILIFVLLCSGCSLNQIDQGKSEVTLTQETLSDATQLDATMTPTKVSTATVMPTEIPTATLTLTPTMIPTPGRCTTPMSLMLHSGYGVERMEELVNVIKENNLVTITYEKLYEDYFFQGKCPPKEAILVSVDDPNPSDLLPIFRDMIQVFIENNMVLSLGVITKEPYEPEAWEYLRAIQEKGIELSSHTVNHPDLLKLDENELQFEIEASYNRICDNSGKCPYTLVLPYGNGSEDAQVRRIAKEVGYLGLVSVSKGENYFGGDIPHVFRRVPPNYESQDTTLYDLRLFFGNW